MAKSRITQERAALVAKSHACDHCKEYSFKRLQVKPATASQKAELHVAWVATRLCGVCGLEEELGIDAEGQIVYG